MSCFPDKSTIGLFMSKEEQLNIELNKLKAAIPEKEWKYYHLQSVENFIYHLKSLDGERTRDRMAIEIEMYISQVADKVNEESSVYDKGKELFPAIWKMSDTYENEVGFISKPSYVITGILIVALFLVLRLFNSFLMSLGTCFFILIIYISYCYYKMKDRKFF